MPKLYKAKKLIIDIRENGGGNTEIGLEILSYFTNDNQLYKHKSKSRKHLSLFKANGAKYSEEDTSKADWIRDAYLDYHNKLYTQSEYSPYIINHREKRIVIPTIILTSHNTVSAAEDFLVPVKEMTHIKTMGETTAGSTGTPYRFELHGGGKAQVCTLQSFYPDGTEFVGIGIKPNIEINRTINGIINIEDEVLNSAIKSLNDK